MEGDASSASRRSARPPRRGQLWRPQPRRAPDPPRSAAVESIGTSGDRSQHLHEGPSPRSRPMDAIPAPHPPQSAAAESVGISGHRSQHLHEGPSLRPRPMDANGPSFSSQDVRSSSGPRGEGMSHRPPGFGHRHQDPALFDQETGSRSSARSYRQEMASGSRRVNRGGRHVRPAGSADGNRLVDVMDSAEVSADCCVGDESLQSTLPVHDHGVESSRRAVDSPDVMSSQAARNVYDDQHSHRSRRRQQRRPSSSANVVSGNNHEPGNRGLLISQDVEVSRGVVDEVLQSLSIHGARRGDMRRKPDVYEYASGQKSSRGHTEIGNQTYMYVPAEIVRRDKASIPKLVQELEEKLSKGLVECMICYDMIRREAAVWSCGGCFAMFHISCIRKWARAPISADFSVASSTSEVSVGNWRCPGCQSPQLMSAEEIKYRCFCGQMLEPPVDYYLTPHSCGGPCKKALRSAKSPQCKHICTMQCHPGPCPPCNALAPPQFCPCGKNSYTQRCSELKAAKSCGQICGHQLDCGRHYCQKVCHEGPCGRCDTLLTVSCFCGRKREAMACGGMSVQGEVDWENGLFSCENPCSSRLACGRHACSRKCHPGQCGECELAPGKVWTCPCGKASLQGLLGAGKHREKCTDPIPRCGQICEKLLPCGKHPCQSLCHAGDCPPCEVLVDQKCRCSLSSQTMPCHRAVALDRNAMEILNDETAGALFLCNRTCGKKKNCGRHRCSNRCCPLANDNPLLIGEEDPHLCSLPCGKKLRCGRHTCDELCHNGHCPPCLGSTFTDLSCACGRTSIPPPVPCGTFPPSCPHPCSRPQPCGHAATHQCHFGECPPCIVLTAKECVGGHVVLRNVPCGSKDIKCNKLCGKARQCGIHGCARLCHLPPCEERVESGDGRVSSCGQQCGASRRECQHLCIATCHPGSACPETRCKFPVTITCACGRLTQQVPCDAGESPRGSDMLELAYISSLPLQPVDGKARIPLGQRKLACDEECAKLEKKRVLADAFGMTGIPVDPALSSNCVLSASEALKELLIRDPQWVLGIEDRFKFLLLGAKSNAAHIRVHVFGFMSMEKREIVRQLAERWNLSVNAVGREPKRFLTVHVNSKSRTPHSKMLFGRSALPLSGQAQAPALNPSLDMDPRLVVGLFELPREGDISTLVLRFGGECELVWLNDKNALAVFFDMARAATAIRRVDHASSYMGAVRIPFSSAASEPNSRGGANDANGSLKALSRKKNLRDSNWSEDAWGEEWARSEAKTAWDQKGTPIVMSANPWGALEHDDGAQKNASPQVAVKPTIAERTTQSVGGSGTNVAADNWEDLDN